jgi:hypothetical protein
MDPMPPPVQMVQLLSGFQISQALYAAAKLGIPDELVAGPCTAADVAARLQTDPDATRRLMRVLGSLGVLADDAGAWRLTPLGATLAADVPGSMRDLALMWMETHYAPFARLVDTVRTGEPAADLLYGQPFFGWLGGHPDQINRFSRAMANLTTGIKVGAADSLDLSAAHHVVDVGAADGALLAHLLQRWGQADGVAFDLPHVVADAETAVKSFDLGDRLRAVAGDFFAAVPAGDTYLLSMVLHDWDDERAGLILRNIARAAAPGAAVYSLELVLPPGDAPHMAAMIDLTMLGMLTGRERTEAELRALFAAAGMTVENIADSPTPMSVVRARVG